MSVKRQAMASAEKADYHASADSNLKDFLHRIALGGIVGRLQPNNRKAY